MLVRKEITATFFGMCVRVGLRVFVCLFVCLCVYVHVYVCVCVFLDLVEYGSHLSANGLICALEGVGL